MTCRIACVLFTAVGLAALPCLGAPGEHGLAGPYSDPSYFTRIPFGSHSHWLQPWRAYLETVPAQRFLDGVGVNLHLKGENPDVLLQHLAKYGIANARVEEGWGTVSFDDPHKLNNGDQFKAILQACQRHGVRPMILLNSHHGAPCPVRFFDHKAAADAPAGARQVTLDRVDDLVPRRSGLSGLTTYWAAEALIDEITGHAVSLSKPLPKPIRTGDTVHLATLLYRPFSPPGSKDYEDTIFGWQDYVGTVARYAAEALGTTGAADKGFDLEIWNELTFGTHFLYINDYYDPRLYQYDGNTIWDNLVKATSDYITAHPADFAGVAVANGFGNTIPWTAAGNQPKPIRAVDKHPYHGWSEFPKDEQHGTRLDAQGQPTDYAPAYRCLFPEYFATAIQTETMVRDMGPITNAIGNAKHGRYARGNADPVGVWITEVGIAPNEVGVKDHDAGLALKAKVDARYLAFYLNKGVGKLQLFGAVEGDAWLGVVSDAFAEYARKNATYPADDATLTSPALRVIGRMVAMMRDGLDPKLAQTRPLTVDAITDSHDHTQFAGDGTPAHPPLYNREVFCFLPYQLNAHRFVIAYYVMTRDVTRDLPPEDYTVTVSGLRGAGAKVRVYDPLRDEDVPVRTRQQGEQMVFGLSATDAPRLLVVDEG